MKLGTIFAYFKHDTDENNSNAGTTDCTVARKDENNNMVELGKGHSSVHHTDTFTKSKGRVVTLRRALRMSGLNKQERHDVWQDYFATIKSNVVVA